MQTDYLRSKYLILKLITIYTWKSTYYTSTAHVRKEVMTFVRESMVNVGEKGEGGGGTNAVCSTDLSAKQYNYWWKLVAMAILTTERDWYWSCADMASKRSFTVGCDESLPVNHGQKRIPITSLHECRFVSVLLGQLKINLEINWRIMFRSKPTFNKTQRG